MELESDMTICTTFVSFGASSTIISKTFDTRSQAEDFAKRAKGNGSTGVSTVVTWSNSKTAKRYIAKGALSVAVPTPKKQTPEFVMSVVPPVASQGKNLKSRGKRAQLDLPLLALMA